VIGPSEFAFAIGPAPHETIAVADVATGRILRRIRPGKGEVLSLASTPDGKTLYFAAAGNIWSMAATGGEAKKIRAGESVAIDPQGRYLIVNQFESSGMTFFRVPMDGSAEKQIRLDSTVLLANVLLTPGSLDLRGRLLFPLQPKDAWFNPPGIIDLETGRVTRLPADNLNDHHSAVWARDGRILTLQVGYLSTMWKFSLRQ